MRMTPTFLLMKNDGARLAGETELVLNLTNGSFKIFRGDMFTRRRRQAERKQELLAARSPADGIGLIQRLGEIVRGEAAQLVDFDMLILILEQMPRQILGCAALIAMQDH